MDLRSAKCFACLDLLLVYHQISVTPKDQEKTAFVIQEGIFVFKRMPFAQCNAKAIFYCVMDTLFEEKKNEILDYLNELLIFADSPEKLLGTLENLLETVIKAKLKCNPR